MPPSTPRKTCQSENWRFQACVVAAEEDEWFAGVELSGEDFADHDGVVTGDVSGVQAASNLAEDAAEQWNSIRGPAEADLVFGYFPFVNFLFLLGTCEKFRKILLILVEDVDAEQPAVLYQRQQVRSFIDANGNERGFERNRGKGVGGHAVDTAWGALNGDYGYTRGELAEGAAKIQRRKRGGRH